MRRAASSSTWVSVALLEQDQAEAVLGVLAERARTDDATLQEGDRDDVGLVLEGQHPGLALQRDELQDVGEAEVAEGSLERHVTSRHAGTAQRAHSRGNAPRGGATAAGSAEAWGSIAGRNAGTNTSAPSGTRQPMNPSPSPAKPGHRAPASAARHAAPPPAADHAPSVSPSAGSAPSSWSAARSTPDRASGTRRCTDCSSSHSRSCSCTAGRTPCRSGRSKRPSSATAAPCRERAALRPTRSPRTRRTKATATARDIRVGTSSGPPPNGSAAESRSGAPRHPCCPVGGSGPASCGHPRRELRTSARQAPVLGCAPRPPPENGRSDRRRRRGCRRRRRCRGRASMTAAYCWIARATSPSSIAWLPRKSSGSGSLGSVTAARWKANPAATSSPCRRRSSPKEELVLREALEIGLEIGELSQGRRLHLSLVQHRCHPGGHRRQPERLLLPDLQRGPARASTTQLPTAATTWRRPI